MIEIGRYNALKILRDTDPGLFLGDSEDNEVLLPNRYVPNTFEIDDVLEVFVYLDNEERLVAVRSPTASYVRALLGPLSKPR